MTSKCETMSVYDRIMSHFTPEESFNTYGRGSKENKF